MCDKKCSESVGCFVIGLKAACTFCMAYGLGLKLHAFV